MPVTYAPLLGMIWISPSSSSCLKASLTGVLLTPSSSPMATSFNSSCSLYLPFRMSSHSLWNTLPRREYLSVTSCFKSYLLIFSFFPKYRIYPMVISSFLQTIAICSINSLSVITVTRPSSYCLSTHFFSSATRGLDLSSCLSSFSLK